MFSPNKISDSYTSLTINSKTITDREIASFCLSKISSEKFSTWEYSLYTFILNWISSDEFILVNTSGSTGKPRQIKIEKEKMIYSALLTGDFFDLKKNDKTLLCLPVDFIAGKMMVVRAFVLDLDLIAVEPSGKPLENIESDFDFAAFTPMQVYNILNRNDGYEKLNRIKNVIIGGGEINRSLSEKIQNLKNNTFHTYGMTETITHIALKKLNGEKENKYFKALNGIGFKTDNRSCLVIKAKHLSDDKIITNDVVELKNENEFEFIGRYDNIINSGGLKFFPEKIEKKLAPFIKHRFIIAGMPDEKLGQKVVLIIEGNKPKHFNLEEIYEKSGLSKYEKPKKVFFIEKFPETENGKLERKKILQLIPTKQ